MTKYEVNENYAVSMDQKDPLGEFRSRFLIPKNNQGEDFIYLAGNSLGLQPKKVKQYIDEELEDWARLGVEGHIHARHPWLPYHESLTEQTARLVGALPIEVVVMNTLTVNLHLMMVSFYQPRKNRFKIVMEAGAFPSDQYAIASQVRFHGYEPKEAILEIKPREGESTLRSEDILELIQNEGDNVALILLGNVNYLTGQYFDIPSITQLGHKKGCYVGFDLAHGAGNLALQLHNWGPDFAVWCGYKYLNSGPGSLSGCFIHERHTQNASLPRFAGWWGQNKKTRFQMGPSFDPIPGAEGWQLSNPPIFQMAALRASMEIFDEVGMTALRKKSVELTGYAEFLLKQLPQSYLKIITPSDPLQRGTQLSLKVEEARELPDQWVKKGIICDFREPDIIRIAPTALYNRYQDVFHFVKILEHHAKELHEL